MRKETLALALCLFGCSFEPPPVDPVAVDVLPLLDPPELVSMMSSGVRVGDPLIFAGHGFLAPSEGRVDVTFRGTFSPVGGRPEDVNYTVTAMLGEDGLLETTFGPFAVPFSRAGNQHGLFRGKLFATNRAFDGRARRQEDGSWPEVELNVLPSVVVRALAPRDSPELEIGPPDVIAMTPYNLRIEAAGLVPQVIEYRLGENILVDGSARDVVTHDASGPVDVLGESEVLAFREVPEGLDHYPATIVIYVLTVTGETETLDLTLIVHRGLQVRTGE